MAIIKYEDLINKNSLAGQAKANVNILIDLLSCALKKIDKAKDPGLYGNVEKYTKSIAIIARNNNIKKEASNVRNAWEAISSFPAFLASGEEKTMYQELLDKSQDDGYTQEEFDKGLNTFAKFMGMTDFSLDQIKQKQAEIDQKGYQEDLRINNLENFKLKAKNLNGNFTEKGRDRKNIQNLLKIFDGALEGLQGKLDAFEDKKKYVHNISEEEREKNEITQTLHSKLKNYQEALEQLYLFDAKAVGNEQLLRDAINQFQGFQDFLKDGLEQTNFTRIMDEAKAVAGTNRNNKQADIEKNFKEGIQSLERMMCIGLDVTKAYEIKEESRKILEAREAAKKELERKKSNIKNAGAWIEEWQAGFGKNQIAETRKQEGYPAVHFAKIMAARLIAESERGYIDNLIRTKFSELELEGKVKEILKEPSYFADFFNKLKDDPKMLAKAEKAARTGHGGGLDDMFRNYLLELPAGEMPNDEKLERYMPTVKERIEELKKQAVRLEQTQQKPYAQATEILLLRNMAKIERNAKSMLDVKIPTVGRKLKQDVKGISDQFFFREVIDRSNAVGLIKKGHGGLMINAMQEYGNKQAFKLDSLKIKIEIAAGTYGGADMAIREEAERIKKQLENLRNAKADTRKLCKAGVEVIAEAIVMNKYAEKKKLNELDNIKWGKIQGLKKQFINTQTDMMNVLYPNSQYSVDNVIQRLGELADIGVKQFEEKISGELKLKSGNQMQQKLPEAQPQQQPVVM